MTKSPPQRHMWTLHIDTRTTRFQLLNLFKESIYIPFKTLMFQMFTVCDYHTVQNVDFMEKETCSFQKPVEGVMRQQWSCGGMLL